jgi:hypothetical protein
LLACFIRLVLCSAAGRRYGGCRPHFGSARFVRH